MKCIFQFIHFTKKSYFVQQRSASLLNTVNKRSLSDVNRRLPALSEVPIEPRWHDGKETEESRRRQVTKPQPAPKEQVFTLMRT